ncbi:MAG TPA: LamG domain-containing protein [Candidatus Uhrbacteria bacterium]|nr:LamG domain-containing protein [Candidatus Uhrbacteria bacterium]
MQKKQKSKIKKTKIFLSKFYNDIDRSFKFFIIALLIGLQIALLITYGYFLLKDKIIAGEGIRDTLTYQGKIANSEGVPPPDGQYNMRFRIYNQSTGGTLLWTETWDGTNQGIAGSKVSVTEGIFTVELNSLCGNWVGACASNGGVTFQTDSFYLQVELDYDGDGDYEEVFLPRKRFTATPFAMNADKLDGYDSSDFVFKAGDTMIGTLAAPQFIDNSLLAYYQFNNNANDSSFNSLDGVLQNSPNVNNNVLELDGINQYVSVSDDELLSFGNGINDNPFSISGWIMAEDMADFIILSKGVFGVSGEYQFFTDSNKKLNFLLYDEANNAQIGRIYNTELIEFEGYWLFLTATYDGTGTSSGIKIYLNSEQIDDFNNNSGSYTAMDDLAADLYIGRYNTKYANGRIDDLKIFNRELTANEIMEMYESEKRNHIHANKMTIKDIYLGATNANEGGYLTWDNKYNRFKFNAELYAPNSLPYFNNSIGDRDYTYLLHDNKILAYDFHESTGTTIIDLEGNANGTLNGGADWTNRGYIGYGMKFGNDGDYISFSNPGLLSNKGSVEMWVKLDDIATSSINYLLRMWSNASNQIAIYKQNAADLYVAVGDSGAVDTGWNFPDTNWHHIVLIWEEGAIEVYVNGVNLNISDTYSSLDTNTFNNFYLGSSATANTSLNGTLDSVAMYDNVLTEIEIKNHYNAAFNNLYIINNFSDGNINATLNNLYSFPSILNGLNNPIDPVYFNTPNKVLALAFSEGVGKTTASSVNEFSAEINGADWTKAGYYGYGLKFDGKNDYLVIADNEHTNFGTNNFSIEFWLKGYNDNSGKPNNPDARIISKKDNNSGYEIMFADNDRIIFFLGDGSNTYTANSTGFDLSDNKWHHIIFTVDRFNHTATLIRDGWSINTFDISSVTGSLDNPADLYIGSDAASNFFKGTLDSIIFYNDKLLNIYDSYNRIKNSPEFLIINNSNVSAGNSALGVINQSNDGFAAILALTGSDNESAPLLLSNSAETNDIYKFLSIGQLNNAAVTIFGNLSWDNANNKFILDNNLQVSGDLEINFLQTDENEYIAFDVIKHTLTSSEASLGSFSTSWDKALASKIVMLDSVCMHATDSTVTTNDLTYGGCINALKYDGTDITVYDQNNVWDEDDIVTIFITYEK